MAWRSVQVEEQRVRFVVAASRGERSLTELCREFDISRPTGYQWLRRYRTGGVGGVVSNSRQPKSSPRQTSAAIEQRIVALRGQRPEWGARKLAVLLEQEGVTVPAATVHRVLRRHHLIHSLNSHPQASGHFCREQPNQLWQMDFKRPKGWGTALGPAVGDRRSQPLCGGAGAPASGRDEHVQARLERAFRECGLPEAMLMDHGAPWWNMQSAGGWTQLAVWVVQLGIRLYFSGYRHPQTGVPADRSSSVGWRPRARWNASTVRWIWPVAVAACPKSRIGKRGWTASARSTTTCDRTRRSPCRLRHAAGRPARDPTPGRPNRGMRRARRSIACSPTDSSGYTDAPGK